MTAVLTLDAVAAQTPERRLLFAGLTLSVGRERVGLVGRNGSGKSTLLGIIGGDVAPAGGSTRRSGSVGVLS